MTHSTEQIIPDVPGYEVERLIGIGGMGHVYLARQLRLNRRVAIKLINRNRSDPGDDFVARFGREAELMARISHPNVVMIIDAGDVEGRPYLVMEYVEGGDLRSKMVPDRPMPVVEIRAILGPVLKAVEVMHEQGMVHRDIKPENILMQRGETPKLSDFGIAVLDVAIGSLTKTGHSLGTLGYVAPEQQYGLKVDSRADQFSIAAICYEMATGRKPLGAFPPPDRLSPGLGSGAALVIMKALSEDPSDRYATIGEFARLLDNSLEAAESRHDLGRRILVAGLTISIAAAICGVFLYLSTTKTRTVELSQPSAAHQPSAEPASGPAARPAPEPNLPARLMVPSLKLGLILVPRGEFLMGSSDDDRDATDDERPCRRVKIARSFYLGETEVTVRHFRQYVEETHQKTSAERPSTNGDPWGGGRYNVSSMKWERDPSLNWRNPGIQRDADEDVPVVQISWDDAMEFCKWLTEKEDRLFRLPTEAEWEFACRAGSQARWSFGNDSALLDEFAWNLRNAGNKLHSVATRKRNAYGLFDMHGNVWEWCLDGYALYSDKPVRDSPGSLSRPDRVLRGGSFDWADLKPTRSAARYHLPPYLSFTNYGFRICSPTN